MSQTDKMMRRQTVRDTLYVHLFTDLDPIMSSHNAVLAESCGKDALHPTHTHTHSVSIFLLFSWTKISGELNQCADSEMPLSRAAGNAPERLGDLLRGETEAKSPTLIRKSCAGS